MHKPARVLASSFPLRAGLLCAALAAVFPASAAVVISQVYGGGVNAAAGPAGAPAVHAIVMHAA